MDILHLGGELEPYQAQIHLFGERLPYRIGNKPLAVTIASGGKDHHSLGIPNKIDMVEIGPCHARVGLQREPYGRPCPGAAGQEKKNQPYPLRLHAIFLKHDVFARLEDINYHHHRGITTQGPEEKGGIIDQIRLNTDFWEDRAA